FPERSKATPTRGAMAEKVPALTAAYDPDVPIGAAVPNKARYPCCFVPRGTKYDCRSTRTPTFAVRRDVGRQLSMMYPAYLCCVGELVTGKFFASSSTG